MKTTAIGILTIVIAVANAAQAILKGGSLDIATTAGAITAGIGLIHARDATKK